MQHVMHVLFESLVIVSFVTSFALSELLRFQSRHSCMSGAGRRLLTGFSSQLTRLAQRDSLLGARALTVAGTTGAHFSTSWLLLFERFFVSCTAHALDREGRSSRTGHLTYFSVQAACTVSQRCVPSRRPLQSVPRSTHQ